MLNSPVAEIPVKVTLASASTVATPNEAVAANPNTPNLLTVFVVGVPKVLVASTPVVIITVASASTNTETLPKVALTPFKDTFASASVVIAPKAEVPSNPVGNMFAIPVTTKGSDTAESRIEVEPFVPSKCKRDKCCHLN